MRKFIIIALFVFVVSVIVNASLPTGIESGFRSGDAQAVAKYFDPTLEMSISGKRSMYSKTQATQVLREFFNANQPSNLKEKHSGGKGNSQFSVFTFTSGNGKYRATVFYKGTGDSSRISQIKIEKDTGF
ncbi:MAG: hypothetical protein CSA94_00070 [Bacteroidetes bacterium]|nr:MAG: hypothetical protein CSA94_00070 [Bacteroidota bacterium]